MRRCFSKDWMDGKKFLGGLILADQKRFLEIREALSEG
jgi:hypothetical protein